MPCLRRTAQVLRPSAARPSGRSQGQRAGPGNRGGGTVGHNGLESVRGHSHTGADLRVRVGIGKPPGPLNKWHDAPQRPKNKEQEVVELLTLRSYSTGTSES